MNHQLDHEKLEVYQIELQFVAWATDLMVELLDSPESKVRRITEVFDHLDRAALSSLFNTAEGNGKRQMRQRAKFLMTRGDPPRNVRPAWMPWYRNAHVPDNVSSLANR